MLLGGGGDPDSCSSSGSDSEGLDEELIDYMSNVLGGVVSRSGPKARRGGKAAQQVRRGRGRGGGHHVGGAATGKDP